MSMENDFDSICGPKKYKEPYKVPPGPGEGPSEDAVKAAWLADEGDLGFERIRAMLKAAYEVDGVRGSVPLDK